jgi:phage-related protein
MYKIDFYEDADGYSDIQDYLETLLHSSNKADRIQLDKIRYQMHNLRNLGPSLRAPYVKQLKGLPHQLFELRPMPERIFFAFWHQDRYIFLSHYTKRQNKTDPRELRRALRRLEDWLTRKENSDG